MAKTTYRHFFDIDEEFTAAVNPDTISQGKVSWEKFYPHETFVKLLSDTISVLTCRQRKSIWVEGAYGTGKSHAVLTLKHLLDASEEKTIAYFEEYKLSKDLMNSLLNVKGQGQKIVTVHRYGASSIYSDDDLIFAMQESIRKALIDNGVQYLGERSLKNAALAWLQIPRNKTYFDSIIKEESDIFGGSNVDGVIEKLNTYADKELILLMSKITKVARKYGIRALLLSIDELIDWIKDIINYPENSIKSIVFIWDEFTKYFANNIRDLTGFQKIAELSQTTPFYLIIVTHKSEGMFAENDNDKKILDRFIRPTCLIELPENMAFKLMGQAMRRNDEPLVIEDWKDYVDDLFDRTHESRELVQKSAGINTEELKAILPIHPYAALLLKYLSSAFDSNQRSMFDFIKNDRGDEVKGFQWFIDNYGPNDMNPFLTINMLWDFFYEKGKEQLSLDVRNILDCYTRIASSGLDTEEEAVLKTVLLLQAISHKVGDSVELFIPNDKNLNNAFDGTDLENGAASGVANKLISREILFRKHLSGNKYQYTAIQNTANTDQLENFKKEILAKPFSSILSECRVGDSVVLPASLNLRYVVRYAAEDNFQSVIRQIRNQPQSEDKINAVFVFAKDDKESGSVAKLIEQAAVDESFDIVFIDATKTPLGLSAYENFVENMANSLCFAKSDYAQRDQYKDMANDQIKRWKSLIVKGEFEVVWRSHNGVDVKIEHERCVNIDELMNSLLSIDKKKYPCALEVNYTVIDNMFTANQLKQGVKCGANGVIEYTYRTNNSNMKLENALDGAWGTAIGERYWESRPSLNISKIKQCVENVISKAFDEEKQVSISAVYESLKSAPYGFLPCNLSAFILGFVLREYANDSYRYTDGLISDPMSVAKLQEMIDDIIKQQNTPNPRYKEKYICTLSEPEKRFNEITSLAFDIPITLCTSIPHTRDIVRNKMKELSFPIWCSKYALDLITTSTDTDIIKSAIDLYTGLANNNNSSNSSSDTDAALKIGELGESNELLKDDLKKVFTREICSKGMDKYLHGYRSGMLVELSTEVGDDGQYLNELRKKFDADAANWVWNIDTAQQKIDEVIEEYSIIVESNKLTDKSVSYKETIDNWREKCDYVRIAYDAAKNHLGDLNDAIVLLRDLRRAGTLLDLQKKAFLTVLQTKGEQIKDFFSMSYQVGLFRKVCSYYVDQFSPEETENILKTIPIGNTFILEKSEYTRVVEEKVRLFKDSMGREKLKRFWKEKTGTDNPREWSQKYQTPILCMISDEMVVAARDIFNIFRRQHSDSTEVEKALDFLQKHVPYDKLSDENSRNAAFATTLLKNYAVVLNDIDDVRAYLLERMACDIYEWYGSPEVEIKIRQKAEAKYQTGGGCEMALEKIENMDISDLKKYLRELIKENVIFGIEIIKGN